MSRLMFHHHKVLLFPTHFECSVFRKGYFTIRRNLKFWNKYRIRLCEIACVEQSDWLRPYPTPCGSALESCKKLREDLKKKGEKNDLHLAVIVGADRAIHRAFKAKWSSSKPQDHLTVCIAGFPLGLENLEKWEGIFQSGKSQGILNRLEKSGKTTQNTGKIREFEINII